MDGTKYLTQAFDLMYDPVAAAENGRIIYMNSAALKALGVNFVGRNVSELFPQHVIGTQAASFVTCAEIQGRKYVLRTTSIEGVRVYIFALHESEKALPHTVVLSSMRSNLANIKIAADRLAAQNVPGQDARTDMYFSALSHNYYQLKRQIINMSIVDGLISDTLPFSLSAVNLRELCGDIISASAHFAAQRDIKLDFDCNETIIIAADEELVELMILNLLSNSLRHTKPGGSIRLSLSSSATYALITVTDTGSGIEPEEMGRIFSKYRQPAFLADAAEGSGYGLTIARGIAEKHGGVLVIESRPGESTCVRVTLAKDKHPTDKLSAPEKQYSAKGMDSILTHLSCWLPSEEYNQRLED